MASADKKDIAQRASMVDYLVDRHGLSSLQPFTKVNLNDVEDKIEQNAANLSRYSIKNSKTDTAYALLKIKKERSSFMDNIRFWPVESKVITVKDYDYVVPVENYTALDSLKINNVSVVIEKVQQYGNLKVKIGKGQWVEFDLQKLATAAVQQFKSGKLKEMSNDGRAFYLPSQDLSLTHHIDTFEVKLVLLSLNTTQDTSDKEELKKWLSYNGYLLIGVKH